MVFFIIFFVFIVVGSVRFNLVFLDANRGGKPQGTLFDLSDVLNVILGAIFEALLEG
jgi:hypothetical protein